MRMRAGALILLAATLVAAGGSAPDISLEVPEEQSSAGTIWLEVRTGALPLGTVVSLSTPDGSWSTQLTPFGTGRQALPLSYQVAVPATALTAGKLELEAEIARPGEAPRPPNIEELRGVTLTQ